MTVTRIPLSGLEAALLPGASVELVVTTPDPVPPPPVEPPPVEPPPVEPPPVVVPPTPAPTGKAIASDSIVDRIGVSGMHIGFDDPRWKGWGWLDLFKKLGVRKVRTNIATKEGVADFLRLGVKGLFVVGNDPAKQIPLLADLVAKGLVVGMEGMNERNGGEDEGGSTAWADEVRRSQAEIHRLIPAGIPEYGPSIWMRETWAYKAIGPVTGRGSLHHYAGGRMASLGMIGKDNPATFAEILAQMEITNPGQPVDVTEFNQQISDTGPYTGQLMTADLGSRNTLRGIIYLLTHGVGSVYIYGLLDKTSGGGHGLLRTNADGTFTPRPLYLALQRLISMMADPGPAFTPKGLAYDVEGEFPSLQIVETERRDGTTTLLVWNEASIWAISRAGEIVVAPKPIKLTFPVSKTVTAYDPHTGNAKMLGQGTQIEVPVTASLQLIRIT